MPAVSRGGGRPRVSIGMPIYNGEPYLTQALDSILDQTFREFELVVSDNASTDRTPEIVRAYADRDPRVRYHRSPENRGASRNYWHALELSRGRYFRWAAADDVSGPESLERCVEVLDSEPDVVLAYPSTELIDGDGEVIGGYDDGLDLPDERPSERFVRLRRNLRRCNAVFGLVRRHVLLRTGPLGSYMGSDVVLLGELALHGKFREVAEATFYRRMHDEAFSEMTDEERQAFYEPGSGRATYWRKWRHLWEQLRTTARAPVPAAEKRRVAKHVLRGAIADRDGMARDLVHGAMLWLRDRGLGSGADR